MTLAINKNEIKPIKSLNDISMLIGSKLNNNPKVSIEDIKNAANLMDMLSTIVISKNIHEDIKPEEKDTTDLSDIFKEGNSKNHRLKANGNPTSDDEFEAINNQTWMSDETLLLQIDTRIDQYVNISNFKKQNATVITAYNHTLYNDDHKNTNIHSNKLRILTLKFDKHDSIINIDLIQLPFSTVKNRFISLFFNDDNNLILNV